MKQLFSPEESSSIDEDVTMLEDLCLDATTGNQLNVVRNIKHAIVGSKRQKSVFVQHGLVDRLVKLMSQEQTDIDIAVEGAAIIGSLGRGTKEDLEIIATNSTLSLLCRGLCHSDARLSTTCLRSLRSIVMECNTPLNCITDDHVVLQTLIGYLNQSPAFAECAANILNKSCKTVEQQLVLFDANIVPYLIKWLTFSQESVLLPVINCLCSLVVENSVLAAKIIDCCHDGVTTKQLLTKLLSRSNPDGMQLAAAKCIGVFLKCGAISESEDVLLMKVLTTFVRMCRKDKSPEKKISASFGLASLIENNNKLQAVAAISDHLIGNVAFFLTEAPALRTEVKHNLQAGAFEVFAAVSANDEKVRKSVIDTSSQLIQLLFESLQENNELLQVSALKCLLSLSRSVRQLRTTFQDFSFWQPILTLLQSKSSPHILSVASSVLCNLLLDFSPCKEALIDAGIVSILCDLTKMDESQLRLNGVWGLMNISFDAPLAINTKIIGTVGLDHILSMLEDDDVEIAMRALGFLRNVLSGKENAGCVMTLHGSAIMQAIAEVLDANKSDLVVEQVFSVLSNIADGKTSKDFLMNNSDVLQKIVACISHDNEKLQLASVFCVTNLVWNSEEDAIERQSRLRELGVETTLRSLVTTTNSLLSERVKVALEQFS